MDKTMKVGKYPKMFTTPSKTCSQIGFDRLLIFGSSPFKGYRVVIGWGIVNKVEKGEKYDRLLIDFGSGESSVVYCKDTIARKQVYTLKKTMPCEVVGLYAKTARKREDGKTIYTKIIVAQFINGWYVPKSFDIKSMNKEELEALTENVETEDLLSQFEK